MFIDGNWMWADAGDAPWKLGVARAPDHAQLAQLVDKAFDRILGPELAKGRVFVIKPNLGYPTDEKGGTTSPLLLEAVLDKIERDCEPSQVYVVESDGIAFRCEEAFDFVGLDDLCSRYGASAVNLSRLERSQVRFPACQVLKEFAMPSLFVDQDPLLISLAKIKTHEIAGFSGAVKNLYGLNPYVFKLEYHSRIDDVLCDIYRIFRPDLSLVDGLWAIDGHGPWTGHAVRLGVLIASNDALAADLASLQLIGWQPQTVRYLDRLLDASPAMWNLLESLDLPCLTAFRYHPATRMTILKERLARWAVPFLKHGLPLVFPSNRQLKMVTYGPGGRYCHSILSWPSGGNIRQMEKQR